MPGASLCDGMAYEYAEEYKLLAQVHDFEQDIVTCARGISKRYMGSKRRAETLEQIALTIFDSMKRVHGMGRENGCYFGSQRFCTTAANISAWSISESAPMRSSWRRRSSGCRTGSGKSSPNVVRYNHLALRLLRTWQTARGSDREAYLTIVAKLTAILRLAKRAGPQPQAEVQRISRRALQGRSS